MLACSGTRVHSRCSSAKPRTTSPSRLSHGRCSIAPYLWVSLVQRWQALHPSSRAQPAGRATRSEAPMERETIRPGHSWEVQASLHNDH
eukprot:scaffold1293_cov262-Pinguiococcus_pyrenoidosus.AAC.4